MSQRECLYLARKKNHLCVQCGKADERTASGCVKCARCTAMEKERKKKAVKAPRSGISAAERKRIRDERVANHICVTCGNYPAKEGKLICKYCDSKRAYHRADSPEQIQMCLNCTKPRCSGTCSKITASARDPFAMSPYSPWDKRTAYEMLRNGSSPKDVAAAVGISGQTLRKWMNTYYWEVSARHEQ